MKIAIAGINSKESKINIQGGRAPYYFLFNEKKDLLETIKNPFAVGGGGAGIGVAKMLADKGVDLVIAGSLGNNMVEALKDRGLKYKEIGGEMEDALIETIKDN